MQINLFHAMRVLHVIPSISPKRGGPSQGLIELVREQVKAGLDVLVVTTNDDADGVLDVPLGKPMDYSGIPVIFFPKWNAPVRALREFTVSTACYHWLKKHIDDFDVVHVHALFSFLPSMAMRLCRKRKIPYIVRPSGLLCRWSLQQSRRRKELFLALSDRRSLNQASMIEYTAELEKEEASDLGLTAPTCVIPYGLHLEQIIPGAKKKLRENLGINDARPLVLYMSRVHPKKGIEPLLDAFELWDHPEKFLVIAGNTDGEYDRRIIDRVKAGPLKSCVHFWGFATGDDKQMLLQGADVFVLPSYSESFGIVVAEAIASGTSVITTRGVPLFSFIEQHQFGWVVEPTGEGVARALQSRFAEASIDEAENARAGGRNAVAEVFGWDRVCGQVNEMYSRVLVR